MILFLVHPEVFRLARRVATLQSVGETVFFLLTVALLAGYGAYLANTMRVRAREARQFNQYRLRDRIGGGGMGEVYLAEHRLLKRACALKVIRPERASDPRRGRFEHEVRGPPGCPTRTSWRSMTTGEPRMARTSMSWNTCMG